MAKWQFERSIATDYPTLGFVAEPGDILIAAAAPDAWWVSVTDTGQPETVFRYPGAVASPDYVEPGDGHLLAWSDAQNMYVPVAASSIVTPAVEEAVETHTPGSVLQKATRTTTFTTTNTTAGSAGAGVLTGLSVTLVGNGRPAMLSFYASSVYHSVANTQVGVSIHNGNPVGTMAQMGVRSTPSTTSGEALNIELEIDNLVLGQSYTFSANVWGAAAGTCTLVGAQYAPIQLKVIGR